ncbi:MAG: LysE family translocator [Gammaproteobacteria bacterium]|nr:LysE family translocator [Gammaproteobacteria bacterium]
MHDTFEIVTAATMLGLSAGLTPGPLLALVVRESLRHGFGAGTRMAVAPLVTDLPLLGIVLALAPVLAAHERWLGALSLVGAAVLAWLAFDTFRALNGPVVTVAPPAALRTGVIANLSNPAPYLFWLGVGAPLIARSAAGGWWRVAAFIGAFYACLVGGKILLTWLVARSRGRLDSLWYRSIMRFLGALLCGFAVILARDGIWRYTGG